MRILFFTPAFPPFPGGGERYVRSAALGLIQQGHEVTVLTSAATTEPDFWQGAAADSHQITLDQGIRVVRCPLQRLWGGRHFLLAWRKAMVLLSALPGDQTGLLRSMAHYIPPIVGLSEAYRLLADEFDVVHGFNVSWELPLMVGWSLARQQRLPFVVTPFTHLGTGRDRVARNSTMDHQLRLLQDADGVLTLTSVEREGLIAWGVLPERVTVIGGGVDPLPPLTDFARLQQQYEVPASYVIFIGRNSYEKGAIHAAEAVLALRQQGQAVNLVLVGQAAPEFERFYGRLTEPEKQAIRPLGIVSEVEKHTLLSQAHLLLLPSRTDSFGIVLLEAWAHGKPVIGARAGGIPGVIDHQQNGLLVAFGDKVGLQAAIHTLLVDALLRQTLGQQGQQKTAHHYTWTQVSQRILACYDKIRA